MEKIYVITRRGLVNNKLSDIVKGYTSTSLKEYVESFNNKRTDIGRIHTYYYNMEDEYVCLNQLKNENHVVVRKGTSLPLKEWVEKIISEYPYIQKNELDIIGNIIYLSIHKQKLFKKYENIRTKRNYQQYIQMD